MNNYKSAKNFIKAFSLKRCPTLDDVTAISQKQGFTVRPFLPWRDSDINLIRSLNCDASMLGRFAFSFCSDSVKFIFVLQSLTEAERVIAILHENIHIYLGHLGNNCSATVSEEKQVTDIHAAIDFLISKKTAHRNIGFVCRNNLRCRVFFLFSLHSFRFRHNIYGNPRRNALPPAMVRLRFRKNLRLRNIPLRRTPQLSPLLLLQPR